MSKPTTANQENIHCLLIDLDNTLYPHANGIWAHLRDRINQFLLDEMHFPPKDVTAIRHRLWQEYGTTLRGLQVEFSVDTDAFLTFVHDIPLDKFLTPDPHLDRILKSLPQRKVIFTNANTAHAQRVTDLLGVTDHFDTVVDINATSPFCKPEVEAFHKALALIEELPEHCLMIDDSPANLETASALGIQTISIGEHHHPGSLHIETIHQLADVIASW